MKFNTRKIGKKASGIYLLHYPYTIYNAYEVVLIENGWVFSQNRQASHPIEDLRSHIQWKKIK